MATVGEDGAEGRVELRWLDVSKGSPFHPVEVAGGCTLGAHFDLCTCVAVDAAGGWMLSGGAEGVAHLWRVARMDHPHRYDYYIFQSNIQSYSV